MPVCALYALFLSISIPIPLTLSYSYCLHLFRPSLSSSLLLQPTPRPPPHNPSRSPLPLPLFPSPLKVKGLNWSGRWVIGQTSSWTRAWERLELAAMYVYVCVCNVHLTECVCQNMVSSYWSLFITFIWFVLDYKKYTYKIWVIEISIVRFFIYVKK